MEGQTQLKSISRVIGVPSAIYIGDFILMSWENIDGEAPSPGRTIFILSCDSNSPSWIF